MIPDLLQARELLRQEVGRVIAALADGARPDRAESQHLDLKEEAGRRDQHGGLIPGVQTNSAAAEHLAPPVRCFANSPGGGALILGVEDTGTSLIGTALDPEWLRQRLDDLTGIAPAIEPVLVRGVRLLVLYVSESLEPVEDPDRRLRWRIGDQCRPVDRSEWWRHRSDRLGVDPLAAPTPRLRTEISAPTASIVRRYLVEAGETELAELDDARMFTALGVVTPDDHLTQAGVLLFCGDARPRLEFSRLETHGGDVLSTYRPDPGSSLIEALSNIEARLQALNAKGPSAVGFVERPQTSLPARAVREAVLNHLIHRDWMSAEPTAVRWIDLDEALQVSSPGGFTGGVSAANLLTTRHSRYPALADLFRALRLVDRQGVGVPRMYQSMIAAGLRSPVIEEVPGPRVTTTLTGRPRSALLSGLFSLIEPRARQRDVRVAVLADALLRRPFLTVRSAAVALQSSIPAAESAIAAAEECLIDERPLIARHADAWILSPHVARAAFAGHFGPLSTSRDMLWFRVGGPTTVRRVAELWLAEHDRVASGDIAAVTGIGPTNVSAALSALAGAGDLITRGPGRGRAAHFVRRDEP